jgi:predicted MFS family arabinose efflux permease
MLLSCEGVGALIGATWLTSRASLVGLTRITLANILLMSVTILLFSQTTNFWIAVPINAFIGFAFIVQSVSNQTLIQSAIEPGMRGRVMSIYGIIAAHTGLRTPVAVGAIIVGLLWAWAWRLRVPLAAALETEPEARALAAD